MTAIAHPNPTREQIFRLQAKMLQEPAEMPEPVHFFAPGMYLRRLVVPAGMLIVGKTHRHDHFLIVTTGRALVISAGWRPELTAMFRSVLCVLRCAGGAVAESLGFERL